MVRRYSENSGARPALALLGPTASYASSGVNPPPGRLVSGSFFLLVLLVSSADLKRLTSERIHWVALAAFLVVALPMLARARWRIHGPLVIFASMILCAVVASGWGQPLYACLEAAKLALILVLFTLLLINHPQLPHTGFFALEIATWLNLLCLASIAVYPGLLASMMAPGRWGTILNAPGSLWRPGAATLVCAAYRIIGAPRLPLRGLLSCGASIVLIYADGSRTAMILLAATLPVLLVFAFRELRQRAQMVRIACVVLAACAGAAGVFDARQRILSGRSSSDAVIRVQPIWDELANRQSDGLAGLDLSRSEMLDTVLGKLRENPIWGSGIGGARVQTPGGGIVVHMTYLQVWSDLGVLGLLGHLGFTFFWVPGLPRFLRRIRTLARVEDRALYTNAMFVLAIFCASAFFHPLSTELPEWLPFSMAAALFIHLASAPVVSVHAEAVPRARGGESPAEPPALPA